MSDIELKNCRCMCGCVCVPKNGDDNTRIDYQHAIEKIEALAAPFSGDYINKNDVIAILKEVKE